MRLPSLWRDTLHDEFEKTFENMFRGFRIPTAWGGNGETKFIPDVDVIEHDNDFLVKAELPGMDRKDIDVSVVNGGLQIKGEKKTEKEEKKENYYSCECSYGAFYRMIPLPADVDAAKIDAKLEKGVLMVTLPKSKAAKATKIEVKG